MLRNRRQIRAAALVVVALLLAAGSVPGRGLAQGDDSLPPEVAANLEGWALPNHDYANTRATMDAGIDSSNVATVGEAWTFEITGTAAYGGAATNPLVLDGVIYFQDLASNIHALNLEDGSVLWQYEIGIPNIGPNGVAVGYGKVFGVTPDSVVALNMEDGSEVWATNVRTQNESEGITIQPVVWNNMVYMSTVPGSSNENFYAGGVGGIIYALDQESGEILWGWDTVDSEDLWGNPEINSGGGAWYPPAIDTEAGMSFWSVANPAPWPGTEEFPNGSSRPGDNLYTNTLVALEPASGEMAWYNQVRPHDLFDLDLQSSPILTQATINGEERSIVITAGKLGRVYAMDRASGEILWDVAVGQHKNDDVLEVPEGQTIEVLPGVLGGVETPMAYAEGMLYVPIVNLSGLFTPTAFDASTFDFGRSSGELVAIDVNTGAILWTHEYQTMNLGGATVVNDLVFTATMDGMIYAYDRVSGEEIWTYQSPAGINGWPAVAGDMIVWPAGMGATPVILALRTGVTEPGAEPAATEEEAPPATEEAGVEGTAEADTSGIDPQVVLQQDCTLCHDLEQVENASKTAEEWAATIDRMISYGAPVDEAERQALIEYLAATHGPEGDGAGSDGGYTGP